MAYQTEWGDSSITASAKNDELEVSTSALDELEYDCWELIKKYAQTLGVELEVTDESDNIDFLSAKTVQDTILTLFEDNGFKLRYDNQ